MLDLGIIAVVNRLVRFYKKRLTRALARISPETELYSTYLTEMDVVEELEVLLESLETLEIKEISSRV